jgi:DSF synthase
MYVVEPSFREPAIRDISARETSSRDTAYQNLRVETELDTATHWCFMHGKSDAAAPPTHRPCFHRGLLREMQEFQRQLSDSLRDETGGERDEVAYLVLGSDASVFNLGGDLELFARLIREQNRETLYQYARLCVEVAYGLHRLATDSVHSIAVVQGDALGGGFEAALCCHTIIAEEGCGMGFPEVLFDLFPGMGAYSFLSKRVPPVIAERMMLDGNVHSVEELHRLGVVDILVPKGHGLQAARDLIKRERRIPHARRAMNQVRAICQPVTLEELTRVTTIWVDTAMQLGPRALATMERLVRAQQKRHGAEAVATPASNVLSLAS